MLGGFSVESDQSLHQMRQIIRSGTDVVGDWHARLAVVLTDKSAFGPQPQMNEAVVSDHNAMQTQEFVLVDRLLPGLANGAGPTLDAVLRRMLALNGVTGLRILDKQEGGRAREQIARHWRQWPAAHAPAGQRR